MLALALVGGAQMMWAEETQWVNVWEEDIAKVCTDWVSSTTTTNGDVTLTDNGSYKNMTASSGGKSHTFNQNLGIKVSRPAQLMCRYQASTTAQNAGIYYNWNATSTIAFLNVKEGQRVIIGTTSNTVLAVENASTDAKAAEAYTHTYLTDKTITYYKNTYTVTSDGIVEVTIPAGFYVGYAAVQKQYVSGTCENPEHSISGTAGNSRKFTLSCPTEGATIYYSETEKAVEDDGWIEYKSEVTTNAETVYAYAKTNDATSDVISFATGAGTTISLSVPYVSVQLEDGVPTYTFTSNNSALLGAPTATLTAKLEGEDVALTDGKIQPSKRGSLTVTASAEGYADAEITISVAPKFVKVWESADFSSLTEETVATVLGENWAKSDNTGRWASWSSTYEPYTYYTVGGNSNITVQENLKMRSVVLLNLGYGIGRDRSESVTMQNMKEGYISSFALYNGYGKTDIAANTRFEYHISTGTTTTTSVSPGNVLVQASMYAPAEVITLPTGYTYSTFCSTSALDFTDNEAVEAYIATADGTTVTLTPVNKVPANTGLILKKIGDATTATVPVAESVDAIGENDLVAVTKPVTAEELVTAGNAYILVSDTQFSKVVYGATGEIPAGKAYLRYDAPVGGASATRLYVGEATAAASVEAQAQQAEQAVYTLQGIRVSRPTAKGLYIVDGKVCLFK